MKKLSEEDPLCGLCCGPSQLRHLRCPYNVPQSPCLKVTHLLIAVGFEAGHHLVSLADDQLVT